MKIIKCQMTIAISMLVMLSICSLAQPPIGRRPPGIPPGGGPQGMPPEGRPGPPFGLMDFEMRLGGKVVKGAPFSATIEIELRQTLADGTVISRKNQGAIFRDSEGRIRREQTISSIGPFATLDEPLRMIQINDVVKGENYLLDPKNQNARVLKLSRDGAPIRTAPDFVSDSKVEALGKQIIEGVEAEGTRRIITIPTGRFGNDRPIEIINERWESPELQVEVLSSHRDPRTGEHRYRLTNISRSEPDATLFSVPSDYKIMKGRTSTERRERRGRQPRKF